MNALELFSGTQSIGKVLRGENYNVISVDITDYNKKHIPTHKTDIMDFDYKQYPVGHFDIIHASPPCVYYSNLQYSWIGRTKKNGECLTYESLEQRRKDMDKLVLKSIEIIDYFKPRLWTMENPATGNLKKREVVKDIPFYDVDYCMYSDWGYKKKTRFWTNNKNFVPKLCNGNCENMIGKKHRTNVASIGGGSNRLVRYKIPPKLIKELYFKQMNALELFSGTQSIGKVLKDKDYNVISVDITDYNKKHIPTHKVNILDFDYKQYPVGHFDIIHGSPPCIPYSTLKYSHYGRMIKERIFTKELHEEEMNKGDIIVKKTLEIIDYFKPRLWTIENPQTGLLKNRDFMKDIPYYDIDYCMYSDWGYKKRTRFWTNIKDFNPKLCNKKCENMIDNRHKGWVGREKGGNNLSRYRIPPKLILELYFE
mgnify:FL=1